LLAGCTHENLLFGFLFRRKSPMTDSPVLAKFARRKYGLARMNDLESIPAY
jgi:hypothetical protein